MPPLDTIGTQRAMQPEVSVAQGQSCGTTPWPAGFPPFHPRRWMANGHLQTIFGNFLPRPNQLPPAITEKVVISPAVSGPVAKQIATEILCECHWQVPAERASRPTVLVLHGLEGSSKSQYVIGNADKLWKSGCNVIRMNMRNCGGSEQMTPTLYHSGLSGDVDAVMRHFIREHGLESVTLVGYSMGGNLVLKLAGELGSGAPPELRAVVGVSAAVDLGASADALHRWQNRVYERKFLNSLLKRFRRKAALFPRAFDPGLAMGIGSVRAFDERITALYSGFRSADDYYYRAAAARVLDRIDRPTLLLHACDDPFVILTPETRATIAANPRITLLETEHGGHCAFLAEPAPPDDDGYWAEARVRQWVLAHG